MQNINHQIIKIGVTGHRLLEDEELIRKKVHEILQSLNETSHHEDYSIISISPIAEGSDRLVAKEILSFEGNTQENKLVVVLPLEKEDYMNDFETIKSKKEFEELTDLATKIITLKEAPTRNEAYLQVGKYVADMCDVLIAIWDGKESHGKGSTAEIVDYAKCINREIIWINSVSGKINILN
ncbi:hypothetical protein [uncultured Methanobacterium sp.]|uniref:hypothetical protein n=1 Tax=uncultured Methanobacterium sp. TaxID=176306 RepID=UPI002AA6C3D7|nr:hypothetical protein [uncultured Methanobacterium sp.]